MKRIVAVLVRIIPLMMLLQTWTGMEGVKEYVGYTFYRYDRPVYLIGLLMIFIPAFLKAKPSVNVGINTMEI